MKLLLVLLNYRCYWKIMCSHKHFKHWIDNFIWYNLVVTIFLKGFLLLRYGRILVKKNRSKYLKDIRVNYHISTAFLNIQQSVFNMFQMSWLQQVTEAFFFFLLACSNSFKLCNLTILVSASYSSFLWDV